MKWKRHKFNAPTDAKPYPCWEAVTNSNIVLCVEPEVIGDVEEGEVDLWVGVLNVHSLDRFYNRRGEVVLSDTNPDRLKTRMEKEYKKFVTKHNKRIRKQMDSLKKSLL